MPLQKENATHRENHKMDEMETKQSDIPHFLLEKRKRKVPTVPVLERNIEARTLQ